MTQRDYILDLTLSYGCAVIPAKGDAYYHRAIAYAKQEKYKSATQDARKACELSDCKFLQYLSEKKLLRD
ncbi:MAG: hypothetical protein LBQ52_00960 [Helicobacteraceae bacterium]|nr:hypothetical protein [Helicobacteraceae bacterium]